MKRVNVSDYGAGNTNLYTVVLDAEVVEAKELNSPNGEPSGYARTKNGKKVLGLGLYGLNYKQLSQLEEMHINLKQIPTKENEAELITYFQAWLQKMKEDHPEHFGSAEETYWLIGCPTGGEWKKGEVRDFYKSIFERAGYENVIIVPESNAALAYYQKTQGIIDNYDKNSVLLLIDQGAYSLDATSYGEDLKSYGSYLGASLVDRMMVRTVLYGNEETNRIRKKIINYQDVLTEVRDLYEEEGVGSRFHTFLLLKARRLKEDYFDQLRNGTLSDTRDLIFEIDYDREDEEVFSLFTNEKLMNQILYERSVKDVLGEEFFTLPKEVQKELGDYSWMQAFDKFLDRVDQQLSGAAIGGVMLTGGGSLMKCVSDAVQKHYAGVLVYKDEKAISAIGKGMAYWAPDKIRALYFENAFEKFTDKQVKDDDGDDMNMIILELAKGLASCVEKMQSELVEEEIDAVMDAIEKWANYECYSSQIPDKIQTHMKDWCKQTGIPTFEGYIDHMISSVKQKLNVEFRSVLKDCNLEQEDILKENDEVFLSMSREILKKMFDCMIELIVEHYKENDIWSKFSDKKKGFLSNPRREFVQQCSEALKNWMVKEVSSTGDLLKHVAYEETGFLGSDDLTFALLFVREGCSDLTTLMEGRVKKILGTLVLEEYIED